MYDTFISFLQEYQTLSLSDKALIMEYFEHISLREGDLSGWKNLQ